MSPRDQAQPRYRSNRGKGLPPEAEGPNSIEVSLVIDLTRSVSLEGKEGVRPHHSLPIVHHRNPPLTPLFYLHRNNAASGIQRIFHQLLHHRGRPLNHLPRCYLTHPFIGEAPYLSPHPSPRASLDRPYLVAPSPSSPT